MDFYCTLQFCWCFDNHHDNAINLQLPTGRRKLLALIANHNILRRMAMVMK